MNLVIKFIVFLVLLSATSDTIAQTGVIKVRKKKTKVLCLNGYTDGAVQPYLLCEGKGLYVTNSDQYTIKKFVILIESVKQYERQVIGNVITGEICGFMNETKTGDFIYINKIIAIDNKTGMEINLTPLKFQVRGLDKSEKKARIEQLNEE